MHDKKLSKRIINLYGLPAFGFQLIVCMEIFYFAAFLTDYAMIPVNIAGTILVVTSIFDIVCVPVAGIILEKCNFKFGKYRSWLLFGPPVAVAFFLLQFSKIGSPNISAAVIIFGFVVSHLVWNIYYAAHVSMNNSMTQVREERIAMASNRGMGNALGVILFSLVSMPMITFFGKEGSVAGYSITTVIGGIIMVACYLTMFVISRDYAVHGSSTGSKEKTMSVLEMFRQIMVNPPLIGLMLAETGRFLGRFVVFGMAFYYFKYVTNDLSKITLFFTGLSVVCFFGAIITNPIARRIGERNTYIISLLLFIIGLMLVWLMPMNTYTFIGVMFVAYLGYGMPDALGIAMYSATVDYGEWKTGQNARGFIMSLISFPIKIGVFLRSIIITWVLSYAGYVANMDVTPKLVDGIKTGFACVPALFLAAGLISLLVFYKITPASHRQMQIDIANRK